MLEGGQPERPAIAVLSCGPREIEHQVLAGIEEEGVPFVLERALERVAGGRDAATLAGRAAVVSSLDVGVGIDAEGGICIQHQKFTAPVPGLSCAGPAEPRFARMCGHNAARIVVGMALRLPA